MDKMLERSVIEVAPLAFMRGRTLNDAFIIMDEAQNTTSEQMKMFLTRLGNNAKAVITGDITQIDLPNPRKSGLIEAIDVLKNVDGIDFCYLSRAMWCAINWCSGLFAPTMATPEASGSCRWKSQSHCAAGPTTSPRCKRNNARIDTTRAFSGNSIGRIQAAHGRRALQLAVTGFVRFTVPANALRYHASCDDHHRP